MEMGTEPAPQMLSSLSIVPLACFLGPRVQRQQKVTCQTDTPCSSGTGPQMASRAHSQFISSRFPLCQDTASRTGNWVPMTGQNKASEWRPADCHYVFSTPHQAPGTSISIFGGKRTGTEKTGAPKPGDMSKAQPWAQPWFRSSTNALQSLSCLTCKVEVATYVVPAP